MISVMMRIRCWKRCEVTATVSAARITITTATIVGVAEDVVGASALMTARIAMMTVMNTSRMKLARPPTLAAMLRSPWNGFLFALAR